MIATTRHASVIADGPRIFWSFGLRLLLSFFVKRGCPAQKLLKFRASFFWVTRWQKPRLRDFRFCKMASTLNLFSLRQTGPRAALALDAANRYLSSPRPSFSPTRGVFDAQFSAGGLPSCAALTNRS